MRLFIGIEIPNNVRKEAARMQDELKGLSIEGRFVPVKNMHITLCFLGESDDLAGAASAMKKAVEGIRPFSLHLGDYSCFEHSSEAKTAHISVKGQLSELNTLYKALNSALNDEGFKTSKKKYTPHITLGRSVVHDELTYDSLLNINPPLNASMSVNSIVLFESVRRGNEVFYIPLHKESLV